MRVDKREFTWFSQIVLLDQTRTRVTWQLTSESLHENYLNFHFLIKREPKLHESWHSRVYMRVFSTSIVWSNENKSCIWVGKRKFTWEFSQLSLLDQTASESSIHLWKLSMLADSDRIHSKNTYCSKNSLVNLEFHDVPSEGPSSGVTVARKFNQELRINLNIAMHIGYF
jgi:hypothetical protein